MSSIYSFFAGGHNASGTLIVDGNIISSLEEERIARIKAGDIYLSYPNLTRIEMEKNTGVLVKDVDHVIFSEPTPTEYVREFIQGNFETLPHHHSHCYAAYFTSGMEGKVMTISSDGGGESSIGKVFLCENSKMDLVHNLDFPMNASISALWGASCNGMMGYDDYGNAIWNMMKDEGKIMGMAPDGKFDPEIYNILKTCVNYENLRFYPSSTHERARVLLDSMRKKGYFNTQEKRQNYSNTLQQLTEDLFLNYLNDLHIQYPEHKKLCFAGGLFANVKLNKKINELDWVDEIYILPCMGDEGLSMGGAIYKSVQIGDWKKPKKLNDVFLGTSYSDSEVEIISQNYEVKRKEYLPLEIAEELNKGAIIGWFQNGFEFGPRALGGRSILVRPTDKETHYELNKRLKRNDIMPFAPSVLSEHFDKIFYPSKSKYTAEFMTLCYETNDEWIPKISAVIQKSDKTARPQVVVKEKNPKYWEIINEYYKLSGIPLLLNTSFNIHNEPIINHPQFAFRSLMDGVIDKLIIGNYVYTSKF
jgi:carbamoyltransferase